MLYNNITTQVLNKRKNKIKIIQLAPTNVWTLKMFVMITSCRHQHPLNIVINEKSKLQSEQSCVYSTRIARYRKNRVTIVVTIIIIIIVCSRLANRAAYEWKPKTKTPHARSDRIPTRDPPYTDFSSRPTVITLPITDVFAGHEIPFVFPVVRRGSVPTARAHVSFAL